MFDSASRYYGLTRSTLTVTGADGRPREIAYVARRIIPPADPNSQVVLATHRVVQGDRIDVITAKYAGDPALFWRICDANGVLDPEEIVSPPGRVIVIAMAT